MFLRDKDNLNHLIFSLWIFMQINDFKNIKETEFEYRNIE